MIFSTKCRSPLIRDDFQHRLYSYIGGIIRSQKGCLIEIGGVEDHIHLLVNLSPAKSISEAIQEIKACSSKWSNEQFELSEKFAWQKGYGVFTVSYSQIESISRYVQNQVEHHRKRTFEEEYIAFLKLHQISFEPKWLFEGEFCG